jgi:hypothetical protein
VKTQRCWIPGIRTLTIRGNLRPIHGRAVIAAPVLGSVLHRVKAHQPGRCCETKRWNAVQAAVIEGEVTNALRREAQLVVVSFPESETRSFADRDASVSKPPFAITSASLRIRYGPQALPPTTMLTSEWAIIKTCLK